MNGTVRDAATGRPLSQAEIEVADANRQFTARSADGGTFILSGIPEGRYRFTVRRLGYAPLDTAYDVPGRDTTIVIRLSPVTALDRVIVGAGSGAYGVVGDAHGLVPLAGSMIEVIGTGRRTVTDSSGRFAVALPKAGRFLVRITHSGFVGTLRWVDFASDYYTDVTTLLDEGAATVNDGASWADFDERMRWRTHASALVPGSELRENSKAPLSDALRRSPSFTRSGLRLGPTTCVFVNGKPKPNWPLDAFDVNQIEAIELYGRNGDPTHTLVWPARVPCGTSETLARRTQGDQNGIATVAAIWLRP